MGSHELVVAVFTNATQTHEQLREALPASARVFSYAIDKMAAKNIENTIKQQEQLRALNVEYKKLASQAGASAEVIAAADMRIAAANRKLGIQTETMGKTMDTLGRKATLLGRTLTTHLTAPIALVGVIATKMFIDFQKNMEMIHTQAGASQAEVNSLTPRVLNLAQTSSPVGPTDLSKGLYHLESLGLRGTEAMKALKVSSDAAGLGIANMEEVTTALGGAIVTGIKGTKDFNQAMGIVNATIGAGNMRLDDYTAALSTGVLPTAKKAGMNLSEFGAALAVLTDRGMGAQMAATRLKMNISMMIDPTAAGARALGDLGIKSDQLAKMMQQPGGFMKALELIKAGMDRFGTTIPGRTRALQDFMDAFGKGRSSSGLLTIVDSLTSKVSSYQGKLAQIQAQQNTWAANVAAYHKTAAYQIDHAWASVQATFIKLGGALAPSVVAIAKAVETLVNDFNSLPKSVKSVIGVGVLIAAALGPILLIGGKIITSFLQLGAVVAATRTAVVTSAATEVVAEESVAASATAANTAISAGALAAAKAAGGIEIAATAETTALTTVGTAAKVLYATLGLIAAIGTIFVVIWEVHKIKKIIGDITGGSSNAGESQIVGAKYMGQIYTALGGTSEAKYLLDAISGTLSKKEKGYFAQAVADKQYQLFPNVAAAAANFKKQGETFSMLKPGSGNTTGGGTGVSAGKAKMLAFAKDAMGKPYVWGGSGPNSFDCSGLVMWAFANGLNVSLPHSTYAQAKMGTDVPSISMAKVGDVVFTGYGEGGNKGPGHEGLIVGIGKNGMPIVESAPHTGARVHTSSLSDFVGKGQYTIRDLLGQPEPGISDPTALLNPSSNYRAVKEAAAKAAAARKALAAANKAALAAVKGIVGPIEAAYKALRADTTADKISGADPSALADDYRKEVALLKQEISTVRSKMVGASATKKAGLKVELEKLQNELKVAGANVTKEIGQIGMSVAKSLGTKYTAQYAKFDAQYSALTKLTGIKIPGLTSDYLKQITTTLSGEEKTLKSEIAITEKKLKTAKGATKTSLQATLDKLTANLATVDSDIEQNMEAKISVLQDTYQTAMDKFDTAFGNIIGEITTQFETQTQDYIDNVIGPQYAQGGLLTPSEQALKDLQDQMNNDSLVNTVNDARQNFISDLSAGADPVKIKQDQAQIKADEDAFKAAALQVKATEERTQADKNYAAAVKIYTNERIVEERKLNDSLTTLQKNIEGGVGSIDDLNGILKKYGVTMTDAQLQLFGIDVPLATTAISGTGGLVETTHSLQDAFKALVKWINDTTGSNVSVSNAAPPPITNVGSSNAATSYSGDGRRIYYTDGQWYYGDGTQASGPGMARGGRVPGVYSGRNDTVMTPLTSGETVIDRSMTMSLGRFLSSPQVTHGSLARGGIGGGEIHIHFNGPVIGTGLDAAAREMAPAIRNEILKTQRRNATSGIT